MKKNSSPFIQLFLFGSQHKIYSKPICQNKDKKLRQKQCSIFIN